VRLTGERISLNAKVTRDLESTGRYPRKFRHSTRTPNFTTVKRCANFDSLTDLVLLEPALLLFRRILEKRKQALPKLGLLVSETNETSAQGHTVPAG
jgi:hypothetical protein